MSDEPQPTDRWKQTPEENHDTLLIIAGLVAGIFICVISTFKF